MALLASTAALHGWATALHGAIPALRAQPLRSLTQALRSVAQPLRSLRRRRAPASAAESLYFPILDCLASFLLCEAFLKRLRAVLKEMPLTERMRRSKTVFERYRKIVEKILPSRRKAILRQSESVARGLFADWLHALARRSPVACFAARNHC